MNWRIEMKTRIDEETKTDLQSPAMNTIRRQMRRLQKAQRTLERKQARAQKRLERESYDWASLDLEVDADEGR